MPYNNIPKYISPQTAIRAALGRLGYASSYQTMKPDLIAWTADAQDLISRLKTYTDMPTVEEEVCDNKIMLPQEMQLVTCASFNGTPMTYTYTKGCNRLASNSVNRCGGGTQFFTLDECYMHFTPALPNGVRICVEGLQRPMDEDGYPLIEEVCLLAISEYIASMICLRFSDKRYEIFHSLWGKHCLRARAELNQLGQAQIEQLGYRYYKMPVQVTHSNFAGPNNAGVGNTL